MVEAVFEAFIGIYFILFCWVVEKIFGYFDTL